MYLDSMGSSWRAYFALLWTGWEHLLGLCQGLNFFIICSPWGVSVAVERGLWPPRDHPAPYRKVDM